MKLICLGLGLFLLASAIPARADSSAEVVNIAITETTFFNEPPGFIYDTGVPLTFQSGNEVVSIAIDWAATGTANFPFPLVNGAEDAIILNGVESSVCNYLFQSGPNQFYTTDCVNLDSSPFQTSVTYSGNWGSAEIGFGGSVPIIIDSTFRAQTIVPEPASLALLAIGLLGLVTLRRKTA